LSRIVASRHIGPVKTGTTSRTSATPASSDAEVTVAAGDARRSTPCTGEAQGFSVHAEVTVAAGDADGRERLCRYAARPPLADAQLSMIPPSTWSWPQAPCAVAGLREHRADVIGEPLELVRLQLRSAALEGEDRDDRAFFGVRVGADHRPHRHRDDGEQNSRGHPDLMTPSWIEHSAIAV
jgi:hypothetical protein